jgi:hypothetical protein
MDSRHRWRTAASVAGLAYAASVFALGFALGAMRLGVLVPQLGGTVAVLLEAPVMLASSWWICRGCIARFRVDAAAGARLLMGAVAFLVLMLAEVVLASTLLGQTPLAYLRGLGSVPGAIGLAAQLAFASFPLLQANIAGASAGSQQGAT